MHERWDQIKEILASALEHSPGERTNFLRQACGQDDGLRAEVESLLANCDGAESLLEEAAANVLALPMDAMVGTQIGAYRIIEKSGQGGMAVVYLAERADKEYRKRVAIKMVRPGVDSDQILRRFRNERQTLATLDHPNIVKLLDGGSTSQGLPYLVMDYVEGVPIDQYCDGHRLSIEERLPLFRTVCKVVHYAHQKLVIHRDLKPSNILITKDGIPRLLDFGIAKLLNPECFQTTLVTMGDFHPMTPEYASPEQVRGEPITSATDIYSLGVLLYELLTGHRPYHTKRHSRVEIERSVCEEKPERPSTVVGRIEEPTAAGTRPPITPELVSRARNTKPEELRRRLQGDLDTIVMMALRKEPQRRFASAEEFSKDIERHLTGLPVKARRPTLFYRGGKFLRRHLESIAAATIVLAVMVGLGTWEIRRIWERAASGRPSAESHVQARPSVAIWGFKNLSSRPDTAWLSTALSETLTTELAAGEKLRTVPGENVARTRIDLALPDADSLASDTLKRVRSNLGTDFVVLGSYLDLGKEGGGQVRLDLRLQDTAKGETVATISETGTETQLLELVSHAGTRLREQLGVGEVSRVDSVGVRASIPSDPEAIRLYSQGLAKLRSFDALAARNLLSRAVTADPSYPLAHSALAKTWLALGYEANAQREAKTALDLAGQLSRQDHLLVEGRYYEAVKQWEKAIETYRTLFNFFPDNLEFGLYLANAQIAGGQGKGALNSISQLRTLPGEAKDDPRIDLAESEAAASLSDNKGAAEAADRAAKKAASSGAKLLIARARAFQCRALANVGQPKESRVACEEARSIYQQAGDLAGVARSLHAMAEVPLDQGDLEQAKKLYEEALLISRHIGLKKGVANSLGNIALIYAQQGDFGRAERTYRQSTTISREIGDKHGMAVDIGNTGDLLHAEGRLTEALAEYKEALALAREVGHKSSEAIDTTDIGDVLADQGDLNGALQMYQQALPIQRDIGERRYYAASLYSVGRVLRQKGDANGAKRSLEDALSISQQLGEKGNAAEDQLVLGALACDAGRAAEAETLARAAIAEFRTEKEADSEILGEALLSRSLLQQGKLNEAQTEIARALKLSEKSRDVTVRMPLEIQVAYVRAAAKDLAGAEQIAQKALAEATKFGFVRLQFEASLAIGQIQVKGKNPSTGRTRLKQLQTSATAKGFELIASEAAAATEFPGHNL